MYRRINQRLFHNIPTYSIEITQIPVIQTIPVTEFESKTTTTPTIPTTTTTTTTTVISTPTTTTVISIPSIPTTVKGERDMLNETG